MDAILRNLTRVLTLLIAAADLPSSAGESPAPRLRRDDPAVDSQQENFSRVRQVINCVKVLCQPLQVLRT